MKQALHIFRKDVHRLWPQILVVSGMFTVYALPPPDNAGPGISALLERGNLFAILLVIASWTLGANLVHEEALAGESPFWITRPYSRLDLLAAKALFLVAFVFLPLVASGALLEARTGVGILANAHTLMVLDLGVSLWLILPVLAIGAVTSDLKGFAGALGILAIVYNVTVRWFMPQADLASLAQLPDGANIAADLPMVVTALGVVGIQYAARKTQWSQASLVVAVIGSALLVPLRGVALLSTHVVNPAGFDLNRIQVSFDQSTPPHLEFKERGIRGCPRLALKVEGLPQDVVLRAYGTPVAEISSVSRGTRKIEKALFEDTTDGYREFMCVPGPVKPSVFDPEAAETIRASVSFAVVSVSTIATIPARSGAFAAGRAGRCELLTPFPENTQLRCDLEEPLIGSIGAGLEYPGYKVYSDGFTHYNRPVRLSPVALEKFDGVSFDTPGGWPFEEASGRPDAHFVLRTERVVGFVRRDLIYREFIYPRPWLRLPEFKTAKPKAGAK